MKSPIQDESPKAAIEQCTGTSAEPRASAQAPSTVCVRVSVSFYSYFKDLTGCAHTSEELPDGSTLGDLFENLSGRFPKLAAMRKSTLMAVGVDYQNRDYVLKDGDEISLFPPVQGG